MVLPLYQSLQILTTCPAYCQHFVSYGQAGCIGLFMTFYTAQTQADHSRLNDQEASRTHGHAPVHIYPSRRRKQLPLMISLIRS